MARAGGAAAGAAPPGVADRAGQLAFVLGASLAIVCGLYRLRTFDTFFHLAAGRHILQTHTLPSSDPFSFSFPGAPWRNHSWGFQLALAALQRMAGFAGLSLWQAGTALAAWLLAYRSLRSSQADRTWGALLALLPLVAFREVLEARPHMLGFVLLGLTLSIVCAVPDGAPARRLLWLLPIQALWTIVHGSHVLLPVVLALATLVLAVQRRRRAALTFLLALTVAFALVGLLAPSALLQGSEHLASNFLEGNVLEWYPVTLDDLVMFWPGRAFLLCVLLSWIGVLRVMLAARRTSQTVAQIDLLGVVLLLVFSGLAFTSRRMLALYAIGAAVVWVPFAVRGLTMLVRSLGSPQTPSLRFVPALGIVALALITVCIPSPFALGLGLMPQRFPEAAVAFMRASGRAQRVYNAYNFGGYLIWARPERGVFIDGRAITVYPAAFLEEFERAYQDTRRFEVLAARYAVDAVLLPVSSARTAGLLRYLGSSASWRQSYRDEVAVLFEPATSR